MTASGWTVGGTKCHKDKQKFHFQFLHFRVVSKDKPYVAAIVTLMSHLLIVL